jgi:hypothetical protein
VEVVGRATELAVIDVFLDATPSGFAALVFEGQPGIGKTTLWSEAVRRATGRDYAVLSCRPSPAEATLSYTGVGDLLGRVEDDVYLAVPVPQRRALDTCCCETTPQGRPPSAGPCRLASCQCCAQWPPCRRCWSRSTTRSGSTGRAPLCWASPFVGLTRSRCGS